MPPAWRGSGHEGLLNTGDCNWDKRGTCTGQQPGRIGSDGLRGKALPCGARVLALEGDSQLLEQLVVSLGWGEARARSPEGS